MIRTKYFRIDRLGLFIWRYRLTTVKEVEYMNKDQSYKVIDLPLGIKIYYN